MITRLFGLTTFERLASVLQKEDAHRGCYYTQRALEAEAHLRMALFEFEAAVCQERGEARELQQKAAKAEKKAKAQTAAAA